MIPFNPLGINLELWLRLSNLLVAACEVFLASGKPLRLVLDGREINLTVFVVLLVAFL